MKNRIFLVAVILGLLATSCKKENENPQGDVKQMPLTITANYEGCDSKINYTESGNTITATWESGDKILVAYDGYVSELSLANGAGTGTATFTGTISYRTEPSANSLLSCYVKDQNNTSALTISDNTIIYTDAAFSNQDGTLAGAAKCNTNFGMATYGDGTDIHCAFSVNTAMCKFTLKRLNQDADNDATLEYKSNGTTVAQASWAESNGDNLVYLAIPASNYAGEQKLVYTCGSFVKEYTLSDTQANFVAGQTYSKDIALPYTLAETFNTAGIEVIIAYDYIRTDEYQGTFYSNGDGTYNNPNENPNEDPRQVLSVKDGKLVFEYYDNNYYNNGQNWNTDGFSVTFDVNNNTYTQFRGSNLYLTISHINVYRAHFHNISVNGRVVNLTEE